MRCEDELQRANQAILQSLDRASTAATTHLQEAMKAWSQNNAELLSFAYDLQNLSEAEAYEAACVRRGELGDQAGTYAVVSSAEERTEWIEGRVKFFQRCLKELSGGIAPLPNVTVPHIFRGAAIDRAQFDARFMVGSTIQWSLMTACSLSADFVPLFYANKQFRLHDAPAVAYILEIALRAPTQAVLHWTGHVKGNSACLTYRWQQEVITPLAFSFRIEDIRKLNPDSYSPLYKISAREC